MANNCGCPETYVPCNTSGCPIQLDYECVIYNKANNSITGLTNLSLNNGATLKLFAEAVDLKLGQLNVPVFSLPCLRATYNINTLRQFAEAVDIKICELQESVSNAISNSGVPVSVVDTNSINLDASGDLFHTIKADVKISAATNNLVSILSDGLYSAPQTLSVNYTTKQLSLSQGNSVDLSSLMCGVGGFLGNIATDPVSALDGQYWYNTTGSALKIKVNGIVKTFTLT